MEPLDDPELPLPDVPGVVLEPLLDPPMVPSRSAGVPLGEVLLEPGNCAVWHAGRGSLGRQSVGV